MIRLVALGQAAGGDDAVALAVLDEVERRWRQLPAATEHVEFRRIGDASLLLDELLFEGQVWIVDALLLDDGHRQRVGTLMSLDVEQLAQLGNRAATTHGLDVRQSVELARLLYPSEVTTTLRIFGIGVESPARYQLQMSSRVVELVADLASQLLERLQAER